MDKRIMEMLEKELTMLKRDLGREPERLRKRPNQGL